jgi:acetyl-CoA C-acetyltransferase
LKRAVILEGARTAFGKMGGQLSTFTASDLGAIAIEAALQKAKLSPHDIQEVIVGTVLQAGQGQIPSKQAAMKAGIPTHVKTETVNKVCASGLRAITMAEQIIRLGDEQIIVAVGMESMSNAPFYLLNARDGYRMGHHEAVDGMIYDGLSCSFDPLKPHMGAYGNQSAEKYALTREKQDQFAAQSHQKAFKAKQKFLQEITPVEWINRKGERRVVTEDEAIRPSTTPEILAGLKPAFDEDGTITAGNAPSVNDGACALVIMDEQLAIAQNRTPIATIIGHTAIGVAPKDFPETPGIVINALLEKTSKTIDDIDLIEINEAFAAVVLISQQIADLDETKVNVNGGAIALGHPIGASGARIVLTLAYELKRRGGGIGIAAICSGGGQGDAIMIEVKA